MNTIDDKKEDQSGSTLTSNITPDPLQANSSDLQWGDKIEIPEDTLYRKVKLNTGCGKIILMIGYSESLGRVADVYTIVNSMGGCQLNIQGLAITISQYLRLGGDAEKLYQKSKEAGNCGSYQFKRGQGHKDLCGKSCFNAILKTICDFSLETKTVNKDQMTVLDSIRYEVADPNSKLECPSCKSTLIKQSGCYNCTNCGYSRCE